MNGLPRIRLGTIFLLFFCAAVGLATYPDPLSALEPAIATAMVIGLLQQFRQLWLWRSDDSDTSIAFARQFALFWRAGLAAVIGSCLATALLDRNTILRLSDEERVTLYSEVLWPIMPICMIIVLCNSLTRWRPKLFNGAKPQRRYWPFWFFAATLALLVVVHGGLTVFLVHTAVAGIEAAIPAQFQRVGVYPDLRDEGYRSFWVAVGATAALLLAGVILILFTRQGNSRLRPIGTIALVLLLLAMPVLFCAWYYFSEFHRISPELAGAGLEASTVDWLVGATLALALSTAGAYQVARSKQVRDTVSMELSTESDSTSLHESAALLFLIAIHGIYILVVLILQIAEIYTTFGRPAWLNLSLWYPPAMLTFAQVAAGLQLCWIRFQRRSQITPWVLPGLSSQHFFQHWLALALLLIVAVPTLNALGFIAWMGPFSLRTLYGF